MEQLKSIAKRLRNPTVLLSIASQIVTLLVLFNVQVDMNLVTGILTAVTSIFVLLGIVSDPMTQNKGFGDDLLPCAHCGKKTPHVLVGGKMYCRDCGSVQPQ